MHHLHESFADAGANVLIGPLHMSVTKGRRFARYTKQGWLLYSPGDAHGHGRMFVEGGSDDLAIAFIDTGEPAGHA
jgi:hypothetical protein